MATVLSAIADESTKVAEAITATPTVANAHIRRLFVPINMSAAPM
jgi:hypothetical protein